ncbi:FtsX-like permease family protein [Myxococcota bacterium]|nr:FtsX-like permease family protein [Myxococcota bacterium]
MNLTAAGILWRIALRNVWRNRMKSLIVGFILFLGTGIIVFGNALVDAVDDGMTRSVTQSVSGHLQVYSDQAKDKLALFGDQFAGMPDIGNIPDFHALAEVARKVPNVEAVVPMGIDFALGFQGNEIDRWLARLRQAVRDGDEAKIAQRKEEVRAVIERVNAELASAAQLVAGGTEYASDMENAKRAASPEFWAAFDQDRLGNLEFLENRIAPLEQTLGDVGLMFLGTDLAAFERNFDRFELVEGTRVPEGQRGFLFNHGFYEEVMKHRVARDLDRIKRRMDERFTLADDAELRSWRDLMVGQYRRVLFQLDRQAAESVLSGLRTLLGRTDGDLPTLLQDFLKVDDANFATRYAWFYEHIAPHIQLYAANIGESIPLQAYTKAGYSKSVNVKVYGTYKFKGLEKSDIGKTFNLLDMVTFRDLYGLMTPERRAEVAALREKAGLKDVKREDAEAALFGGGGAEPLEKKAESAGFDEFGDAGVGKVVRSDALQQFDPAEIERGVALNAAVILTDSRPEKIAETRAALLAAFEAAGMKMRVVDWKEAAGMLGDLVTVARTVLWVIVVIMLLVALVIINNSMVIATMERVKEIGTMRAVGAQRSFIAALFVAETTVLGFLSGGVGALCAAGGILLWGKVGLPAQNAFMTFLFSGPRLYPTVTLSHLLAAVLLILFFALISTLYPAALAARILPRVAMSEEG